MVVLNKIYTKTGDQGTTALGNGARTKKSAVRIAAVGAVDELNAAIGIARLYTSTYEDKGYIEPRLSFIQNDLFDVGADLCRPNIADDATAEHPPLRIVEPQVARLESEIDTMNADLQPLKSFILCGGGVLSAHLHMCRTIARRAERAVCSLLDTEAGDVNPYAMQYVNRLSDWFFVAARRANNNGENDVLWIPGHNRTLPPNESKA